MQQGGGGGESCLSAHRTLSAVRPGLLPRNSHFVRGWSRRVAVSCGEAQVPTGGPLLALRVGGPLAGKGLDSA